MSLKEFFITVNQHIEQRNFHALTQLNPPKPTYFNWVEDVFFPINVANDGQRHALIWKYNNQQEVYSFEMVYQRCNQLVNLLRKYEVPRIIEFPEALPKTISGKIRRVELRANEATAKLNQEIRPHEYFHDKY